MNRIAWSVILKWYISLQVSDHTLGRESGSVFGEGERFCVWGIQYTITTCALWKVQILSSAWRS